ncbi:MAG: peptidoglycan DD-metalloendopeptidase family protein [Pseudomonadota bacterium]
MNDFHALLAAQPVASPLPFDLNAEAVTVLRLSNEHLQGSGFDPGDTPAFSAFVEAEIRRHVARYAAGGYAENRLLYQMSPLFKSADAEPRTLHLGIDLWLGAGTAIHAVLGGTVHSTQDNTAFGDYGPTLILEHHIEGERFFTLYGHLAQPTLQQTKPGQRIETGALLGWLGASHENVGWPPHLHFQVIRDLGGRSGDYPGSCRPSEAAGWLANCPDPNLLLRIRALES